MKRVIITILFMLFTIGTVQARRTKPVKVAPRPVQSDPDRHPVVVDPTKTPEQNCWLRGGRWVRVSEGCGPVVYECELSY